VVFQGHPAWYFRPDRAEVVVLNVPCKTHPGAAEREQGCDGFRFPDFRRMKMPLLSAHQSAAYVPPSLMGSWLDFGRGSSRIHCMCLPRCAYLDVVGLRCVLLLLVVSKRNQPGEV
jgi:hypothetical protein